MPKQQKANQSEIEPTPNQAEIEARQQKRDQTEVEMLKDHLKWLLMDVIPGYVRNNDMPSVGNCLEQCYDIQYQINLFKFEPQQRQKLLKNMRNILASREGLKEHMPFTPYP
jgi:myo-inositol catabolism protein IolC